MLLVTVASGPDLCQNRRGCVKRVKYLWSAVTRNLIILAMCPQVFYFERYRFSTRKGIIRIIIISHKVEIIIQLYLQ